MKKIIVAVVVSVFATVMPAAAEAVKVHLPTSKKIQIIKVYAEGGRLTKTSDGYKYNGTGRVCLKIDSRGQQFTLCKKSDGKTAIKF